MWGGNSREGNWNAGGSCPEGPRGMRGDRWGPQRRETNSPRPLGIPRLRSSGFTDARDEAQVVTWVWGGWKGALRGCFKLFFFLLETLF